MIILALLLQHTCLRLRAQPRQAVDPAGDGADGTYAEEVHRRAHDQEAADLAVHRRGNRESKSRINHSICFNDGAFVGRTHDLLSFPNCYPQSVCVLGREKSS